MNHRNNMNCSTNMKCRNGWVFPLVITVALPLAAIPAMTAAGGKSIGKPSGVVPAVVEHGDGTKISRVTLTERAAQRIDLQTDAVREERIAGATRKIVPYSCLIYDPHGGTWVYASPEPLTFVRMPVVVDFIEGDRVVLREGPPNGTPVATIGVAELYGTEFAVGH
jgi:hypothetical protein